MVRFSRRGEPATEFERALVANADDGACREQVAMFLDLARRIGVDALLAVFDELGDLRVNVPSRATWFGVLWRQQRDAEIFRRLANGDSTYEIANSLGLSVRTVQHIAQRNHSADDARSSVVDARA